MRFRSQAATEEGGGNGAGSSHSWHQPSSHSHSAAYLKPFIPHKQREEELERARQ